MDIAKRYEKSYHHKTNIQPITWLQATLTLAQLNDWDNVIKPRYKITSTSCRLLDMIKWRDKGVECDWAFYLISNIERYKKYPCEKLTNSKKLWRQQLSIPK